jgi:hypothetical protein
MMAPVASLANQVRNDRRPVAADNPFVAMQENISRQIVRGLDTWRDMTEALAERTFLAIYGMPSLQAAVGIDPTSTRPQRTAVKNPLHRELLNKRIAELRSRIPLGGLREAVIRGLLYAGMGRAAIDERGFELARRIRQAHGEMPLSEFKTLVREQFNMLLIDQDAALRAIPSMLPPEIETRQKALKLIKQILSARGEMSAEDEERLAEVVRLFEEGNEPSAKQIPFRQNRKESHARIS